MRTEIQAGWQEPRWINRLLLPVSWFYRLLLGMRSLGYRFGLFHSHHLPVPVIVVGGITVGGSGKTPVVIALCRYLREAGLRPGVISRGYGGASPIWPREVDETTTPGQVGDEPRLIFEQCGGPVVVGPDRVRAGHYLLSLHDCNVLVSDDGFAHFALARDFDIVVLDGNTGFGNGWCLPAGPLREPPKALDRAGFILCNGSRPAGLTGQASIGEFEVTFDTLANLASTERRPVEAFSGKTVHAVAGLGNPERFFRQLEASGLVLIRHAFSDHHPYREQDLDFGDDLPLVMSQKDAVKCRGFAIASSCWVSLAETDLPKAVCDAVYDVACDKVTANSSQCP